MYAALGDDSQQRVERKFKAATGRFHGYWRMSGRPQRSNTPALYPGMQARQIVTACAIIDRDQYLFGGCIENLPAPKAKGRQLPGTV
jgi:hypothetical protein